MAHKATTTASIRLDSQGRYFTFRAYLKGDGDVGGRDEIRMLSCSVKCSSNGKGSMNNEQETPENRKPIVETKTLYNRSADVYSKEGDNGAQRREDGEHRDEFGSTS